MIQISTRETFKNVGSETTSVDHEKSVTAPPICSKIAKCTLWLFNIAMAVIAHLQMIFPARHLHLSWIFQFAMLVITDAR